MIGPRYVRVVGSDSGLLDGLGRLVGALVERGLGIGVLSDLPPDPDRLLLDRGAIFVAHRTDESSWEVSHDGSLSDVEDLLCGLLPKVDIVLGMIPRDGAPIIVIDDGRLSADWSDETPGVLARWCHGKTGATGDGVFAEEKVESLAAFLEKSLVRPWVRVQSVEGSVILKPFVQDLIARTLRGMLSSLRSTGDLSCGAVMYRSFGDNDAGETHRD